MNDHGTGLEGIRVIEIGGMAGVPYATKLLADLGADVIKIEPPEGDRSRTRGALRSDADLEASGPFSI